MRTTTRVIVGSASILALTLAGCNSATTEKTTPTQVTQKQVTPTTQPITTPTTGTTSAASPSAASYKNGEYTKLGDYQSPVGAESIQVTAKLENGVITSLTVTPKAVNEKSITFQGLFVAGINKEVVGKKIDDIKVFSQVNGASLSPKGFQAALEAIKTEAKQ
ncbi:MAG: hypothetical protein WCP97_06505 [bacterium]